MNAPVEGGPDDRWNDDELRQLKRLKGNDFEAVLTVDEKGRPLFPAAGLFRFTYHPAPATQENMFIFPETNPGSPGT